MTRGQPRSTERIGRDKSGRRRRGPRAVTAVGALLLLLVTTAGPAPAQPVQVPDTWGGDFWARPRLTGSWGGVRDELGKKGVVFDVDLFLTPQAVLTGGRDTGAFFWGNAEYALNVDTGKLGLWPGGFLKIVAGSSFGDSVDRDSGALVPVNAFTLYPEPERSNTGLMHATFMQFLSPKFGLLAGKIFTLDAGAGEFTGNYRTQFLNLGLALPMSLALVPISAYGGGVVALPWDGVVLSALVLDPSGTVLSNDLTDAFEDGVMVLATAQVAITPFGLRGTQKAGFMWGNKERLSLDQDPSNIGRLLLTQQFPRLGDPGPVLRRILERFFPELLTPIQPASRKDSTWAMFYSFEQYLWHPGGDKAKGVGVFFTFGTSDGEVNPVKYSFNVGIGGKGVAPGRPHDTFGVGWARTELTGNFVPFLRQQLRLGLEREDAIELYYSAAITSWLSVTADLQIVEPALAKNLGASGRLENASTAVAAGLRVSVRF